MTETEFKNILTNDIKKVEHTLLSFLPDCKDGQESVVQAMEYSLVNGGKRLRPVFTLEFAQACGGSREDALPFACAMEYVHTYSLIHDDLPCMDNDDLRRGKPSCHKAFGEDTALLAGDALLTHAFEIIASSDLSDDKKVSASLLLAQNAGVGGMIGGQVIDLINENKSAPIEVLREMDYKKTACLIKAACELGCISANADDKLIKSASEYGECIGIAFQIQDDILDVTSTDEELGKPVGSDNENAKSTYVSLLGIEKCRELVAELTDKAKTALNAFDGDTTALCDFADYLASRKK